jgi:Type II CAAX prenyl endopeptidase Rce1-like
MSSFSLPVFFVLFGLSLFGAIGILPYSFALNREKLSQAKLPQPVLALIAFLQTAVLMVLAIGVGLLAAQSVGLGAPYIRAALAGKPVLDPILRLLPLTIGVGVLSFAAIALLERYVFASHVPDVLRTSDLKAKAWMRFLASFYGGLDEEILMRLFLVSGLVWIFGRFWQGLNGLPADGAYWTAIILVAILFGLGHLPATRALAPLTSSLVIRAVVLNGVAGIAFGWLYWQYGLEAAMVAHFCADILLHLMGPLFATRLYKNAQNTKSLSDTK